MGLKFNKLLKKGAVPNIPLPVDEDEPIIKKSAELMQNDRKQRFVYSYFLHEKLSFNIPSLLISIIYLVAKIRKGNSFKLLKIILRSFIYFFPNMLILLL
jgi:hypothetical protein